MVQPLDQPFRLVMSERGGTKLTENEYMYGMQRRVGEMIHWQCERRGVCKARVHTKCTEIVKRTSEHLHAPDEHAVICQETKVGIKTKARDSQDTSHQIVSASLVTVSEGTAVKTPRLDSLKWTIQRQRVRHLAAPAQPTTLELSLLETVICCPACSCCYTTRRRPPTGGCGSRYACCVPLLSLRRCSWTSRRMRSTALSRCGRRLWSSAVSFTSHRTCGARCRLLTCKQTTARTRSWLYASDSNLLSRLLTLMMYMSCLLW